MQRGSRLRNRFPARFSASLIVDFERELETLLETDHFWGYVLEFFVLNFTSDNSIFDKLNDSGIGIYFNFQKHDDCIDRDRMYTCKNVKFGNCWRGS